MGEIAEMMLDGTLCEGCGVHLPGDGFGVPRRCRDCKPDAPKDHASNLATPRRQAKVRSSKADAPKWKGDAADNISVRYHCNFCIRHFASEEGARQHVGDVHGAAA